MLQQQKEDELMAKITLTYTDNADGTVKVILDPPSNELFAKFKGGHQMTTAEAMVIMDLLPAIAASFKAEHEKRMIILPDSVS